MEKADYSSYIILDNYSLNIIKSLTSSNEGIVGICGVSFFDPDNTERYAKYSWCSGFKNKIIKYSDDLFASFGCYFQEDYRVSRSLIYLKAK